MNLSLLEGLLLSMCVTVLLFHYVLPWIFHRVVNFFWPLDG